MTSSILIPVILLATALFDPLHVASIRRRRIPFRELEEVPEADRNQVKNYIATHPIAEAKQPVSNNNSDVRYRVHFGRVPADDDGSLVESVKAYRVFTKQGDTDGQWQMAEDKAAKDEGFLLREEFSTSDEAMREKRNELWKAVLKHPIKDNHLAIEPYFGHGRLYAVHIDDDRSSGDQVIGYERRDDFYFHALLGGKLEDLELRLVEYGAMSHLDQVMFRGRLETEDFSESFVSPEEANDFMELERRLKDEVNSQHHAYSVYQHIYHNSSGGQPPLPLNKTLAYVKHLRVERHPELGVEDTGGLLSQYYFHVMEFKVLSDVNRAQVALVELRMAKDFVEWVRGQGQTAEKGYGIVLFVDRLIPISVRREEVFNEALKKLGYSGLQQLADSPWHYIDFVNP